MFRPDLLQASSNALQTM